MNNEKLKRLKKQRTLSLARTHRTVLEAVNAFDEPVHASDLYDVFVSEHSHVQAVDAQVGSVLRRLKDKGALSSSLQPITDTFGRTRERPAYSITDLGKKLLDGTLTTSEASAAQTADKATTAPRRKHPGGKLIPAPSSDEAPVASKPPTSHRDVAEQDEPESFDPTD